MFDRRAIRYLVDMFGADRLLVGSDFPAMTREDPCGKTLRSMGLSDAELADILWHNCFRFLGVEPAKLFFLPWPAFLPTPIWSRRTTARSRGRRRARSRSGRRGCCSRCSATTGGSGPSRCPRPRSSPCSPSSASATPPPAPRCPG
ncbi:MAG TPA: amidohydrolase family protein [Trebonia sp.]